MSNSMNDWAQEHQGQTEVLGNFAAIAQRGRLIEQQKDQAAAIRAQTAVLEQQNLIEQDRTNLERQRVEIESRRLAAEEADRALRREQTDQIKQLRNLLADTSASLDQLRKRHP